jgi:hypothetical protein
MIEDSGRTGIDPPVFIALWREMDPPAELEERVVRDLKERGQLRSPRSAWRRPLLAAVLVAGLLGAGVWFGEDRLRQSPSPLGSSYILLLEGGEFAGSSPREQERRVAEYKAWARELAGRGHLTGGEKLASGARVLLRGRNGSPQIGSAADAGTLASLGGYFVIVAGDDAEALEIARGCPHIRYGGRVVIRRIEPV